MMRSIVPLGFCVLAASCPLLACGGAAQSGSATPESGESTVEAGARAREARAIGGIRETPGGRTGEVDELERALAVEGAEGETAAGGEGRITRSGEVNVEPGLEREVIQSTIRQHLQEVRFCYERRLVEDPDLEGRVMVRFLIEDDGAVGQASVTETTLGDEAVEQCLLDTVKQWRFPAPRGGIDVIVNYPFQFRTQG